MTREEEDELLDLWCRRLMAELELDGFEIDIQAVLGLAGKAAHAVMRPAAPLTTFVVGYAAGRVAADGRVPSEQAIGVAIASAVRLCRDEPVPEAAE